VLVVRFSFEGTEGGEEDSEVVQHELRHVFPSDEDGLVDEVLGKFDQGRPGLDHVESVLPDHFSISEADHTDRELSGPSGGEKSADQSEQAFIFSLDAASFGKAIERDQRRADNTICISRVLEIILGNHEPVVPEEVEVTVRDGSGIEYIAQGIELDEGTGGVEPPVMCNFLLGLDVLGFHKSYPAYAPLFGLGGSGGWIAYGSFEVPFSSGLLKSRLVGRCLG